MLEIKKIHLGEFLSNLCQGLLVGGGSFNHKVIKSDMFFIL